MLNQLKQFLTTFSLGRKNKHQAGTDVMILKIFSQKNSAKNFGVF
jgi:hypothetical protein